MNSLPSPAASVLLVKDDKVLLIKRGKQPSKGLWSLPGGSKEDDESFEECAKRELFEETELVVDELENIGTRERVSLDANGNVARRYIITTFLAFQFSGSLKAGDDAADAGWFTYVQVQNLQTTDGLMEFLTEHANAGFGL